MLRKTGNFSPSFGIFLSQNIPKYSKIFLVKCCLSIKLTSLRDGTNNDMKDLLTRASNELLQSMAEDVKEGGCALSAKAPAKAKRVSSSLTGSARSRLKEDSISKQFVGSLKLLYEALDSAQPHFVRCIKPNNKKLSSRFNSDKVLPIINLFKLRIVNSSSNSYLDSAAA